MAGTFSSYVPQGYEVGPDGRLRLIGSALSPTSAGGTSAASLLRTPEAQVAQGNTEAERAAAARVEANRVTQAEADRKSSSEAAMRSLTQQQTIADADRKQRAEEAALTAGLTTAGQANTATQAGLDRQAQEQLLLKTQAGNTAALTTKAGLDDTNAANASARSSAAREKAISGIPSLMASLTGETSTAGAPSGGAPTAGVDPAQAARDMAFARSKDKIGQIQRGALTSLREGFQSRGIGNGSGLEGNAMASLLGEGQGQLSDVVSDQMTAEANRANVVADNAGAAALKRREQNLGVSQSILSLLGSSAY